MKPVITNTSILIVFVGIFCSVNAMPIQDSLLVGIHEDPPFIIKNSAGDYEGLSVELWENIAEKLDQPFKYREYSDVIGIVRALDYDELDLSINPLINGQSRMEKFEVTQPFFISNLGVAITTASQNQFQIFINNFFSRAFLNIVVLLLLILLMFGTILWLLERKQNKYQFRSGLRGLLDGLWWAAVTMTTVGYGDKAPKTNAGKSLAIIWMFTAVIIISSFTATIASTLTVNSLAADIQGVSDLAIVEKIGIVGATQSKEFLLKHQISAHHVYRTPSQALRALARKDIDVLVHDKIQLKYLIRSGQLENNVQMLSVGFEDRYRSFMLPKKHPLYNEINLRLVESIQDPSWQEVLAQYGSKSE